MSEPPSESFSSGSPASGDSPPGASAIPAVRKFIAIILKVAAILIILYLIRDLGMQAAPNFMRFTEYVHRLGPAGPAVFVAGYAVATVAFIPGSLLTIAAGAVFGVPLGSLYVFAGATIGSCAAFLVGRTIARSAIERRLRTNPKFVAIDRAIGERGFPIVLLLRLSPVFPFNALNYLLGLTKVSFRDYALASIGMIPGTVAYVYSGALVGSVAALAAKRESEKGLGHYAIFGAGLLATVAVTIWITRLARRALKEATDGGDDAPPPRLAA